MIRSGRPKIQKRTNGVSRAGVSGAELWQYCNSNYNPDATYQLMAQWQWLFYVFLTAQRSQANRHPSGRTVFVRLSENVSCGYRFPATNILSVDTGHFAQTYVYSSRTPHLAMAKVSTKVEHRA